MAELESYRRKRDFSRTPEPRGRRGKRGKGSRFVIHKHAASRLHYDLRLEEGGVFRSWALPKGPSLEPGEKHLAVQVEDHPLDYGDFEGVIPEGYGAGTVMIWDRGEWRVTGKHDAGQIDLELDGDKLKGAWTLKRMQGRERDGKQWLLIKRHDSGDTQVPKRLDDVSVYSDRTMEQIAEARAAETEHERSAKTPNTRRSSAKGKAKRKAASRTDDAVEITGLDRIEGARKGRLPSRPTAQLATLVDETPAGEGWYHEIKFDGYRILAHIERGKVRLLTRNGHDWHDRFPALAEALEALPVDRALLDGEVVALRSDGVSDFRRLQRALSEARTDSLIYQVFDLLHCNGFDLHEAALRERKMALSKWFEAMGLTDDARLRYTDHVEGQGAAFFEQASRHGLEGVVSKRTDSIYQGGRNRDWVKTKTERQAEFVVGGYTDPQGSRTGFGSLLIGAYDDDDKFRYCGRVGTGFSNTQLDQWQRALTRATRKTSPFVERDIPDPDTTHWVTPRLVIDVNFSEWTNDGRLRHPRFRGIREDRDPSDIHLSQQQATGGSMSVSNGKPDAKSSHKSATQGEAQVAGVTLTHPDRVLFDDAKITKQRLAEFYAEHAEWILPGLIERPLTLLRCPSGIGGDCFVQKHPSDTTPGNLPSVPIREKSGTHDYLYVRDAADLVALVQLGTIEFHVWNSRIDDLERPDQLVFDLDPAPECKWKAVIDVARQLRESLEALDLHAFLRTTGGKGLHLVVPLKPRADWDTAKAFAEAVCERCAEKNPQGLTLNMSKQARRGKVFLDYLRNGRGATAVASYSVRAKPGATIATPVRWEDLGASLTADRYTLDNLPRRLASLRNDPWEGFDQARQALTKKRCRDAGMEI